MKKIVLTMLVLSLVFPVAGCKKEQSKAPPPEMVVDVMEIEKTPHYNTYKFSGFTSAEDTVEIRARVSGYILEKNFKEGDRVHKGQTLFSIEPDTYEANLKAAQGAVISAKANLDKTGRDLIRSEDLLEQGNTSQSMYDTAKSNYDNARAALMQAQANIQLAELNMKYTRVEAPVSGLISLSNFDKGNLVGPESGVLTTIVNSDTIDVDIGISEEFLLHFGKYLTSPTERSKIQVEMVFKDGTSYPEEGYIDSFDVLLSPVTNTVNAKVKFPNPDNLVLAGQYAIIKMLEPAPTNRAEIPQTAATVTQNNYFVMVVDKDGTVASRAIKVGQEIEGKFIVNDGLENGDLLIINGLQKIKPGMKVKYKKVDFTSSSTSSSSEHTTE